MPNKKVLIIIPAFNEEASIIATVSKVESAGYDYVVVNDGSSDRTLQLCREHKLNTLDLKRNLGIGGAVQAGHKYALENGYAVDVQFDGDGQHDARYIPTLLQAIQDGADLAIGSRFVSKDMGGFKSTTLRRLGIGWLSFIIRLASNARVTDPTSGFRACGRQAIELYANAYPIDYPEPESIVAAQKTGLTVKEVPVSMNERQGGASSIKPLSSVYYMIKVTLAILIAGVSRESR